MSRPATSSKIRSLSPALASRSVPMSTPGAPRRGPVAIATTISQPHEEAMRPSALQIAHKGSRHLSGP